MTLGGRGTGARIAVHVPAHGVRKPCASDRTKGPRVQRVLYGRGRREEEPPYRYTPQLRGSWWIAIHQRLGGAGSVQV